MLPFPSTIRSKKNVNLKKREFEKNISKLSYVKVINSNPKQSLWKMKILKSFNSRKVIKLGSSKLLRSDNTVTEKYQLCSYFV